MLATTAWTVHFSSRDLPVCEVPPWALQITPLASESWLDEEGILDGAPYLLSPRYEYDTDLNGYFVWANQMEEPLNTQVNRARAVARHLNFLHLSRVGKNWRDATEEDHRAFHYWRRQHSAGPLVAGSTWNQEVSLVNQFYGWAKGRGLVSENPIPQRAIRDRPADAKKPAPRPRGEAELAMTPATLAHDGPGEQFEWLPARSFRRWRDVGVRGYTASGLPRPRFRGRWVSRNCAYCDLMVRTGMRTSEQSTVTIWEMPLGDGQAGYRRFWLPAAIAKGGSARWVYVPAGVRRDLTDYAEFDRSLVVQEAQANRRYGRIRRPLVVADPARPHLAVRTGGATRGQSVDVRLLKPAERYRLLVDTEDGLEPALFWLGESGMPITVSTWETCSPTPTSGARRRASPRGLTPTCCVTHLLSSLLNSCSAGTSRRSESSTRPSVCTTSGSSATRWTGSVAGWATSRRSPPPDICMHCRNWRWPHAWRWSPTPGRTRATPPWTRWAPARGRRRTWNLLAMSGEPPHRPRQHPPGPALPAAGTRLRGSAPGPQGRGIRTGRRLPGRGRPQPSLRRRQPADARLARAAGRSPGLALRPRRRLPNLEER